VFICGPWVIVDLVLEWLCGSESCSAERVIWWDLGWNSCLAITSLLSGVIVTSHRFGALPSGVVEEAGSMRICFFPWL
jgi:hypothetical protein